jgi:hypothetical protein
VVADPVIARAAIRLAVAPELRGRLSLLAMGRALVIEYYAARLRGFAVGDLVVLFGEPRPPPG